jgi:hypothetical protein
MINHTTLAIVAMVAALGLLGIVAIESIISIIPQQQQQQAFALTNGTRLPGVLPAALEIVQVKDVAPIT